MRGIYLVAGYPDSQTFRECYETVVRCGFDFIEVGIPFNDPIADGPVIADAIHRSLYNGVTPDGVMEDISTLKRGNIQQYVMTYANIIYSYGIKKFSEKMAGAIHGVIIPDVPNRMSDLFYDGGFGIPIVPFATLETRHADLDLMNRSKSEIIYVVGIRGITGSAGNLESPELHQKISMIKQNTDKKIIIGFGIKTRDDASTALRIGDGYVVGTEAVKRQNNPADLKKYLNSFF
jgi:tryptophan synthase alpha chain